MRLNLECEEWRCSIIGFSPEGEEGTLDEFGPAHSLRRSLYRRQKSANSSRPRGTERVRESASDSSLMNCWIREGKSIAGRVDGIWTEDGAGAEEKELSWSRVL